jgi:hypothetical protein
MQHHDKPTRHKTEWQVEGTNRTNGEFQPQPSADNRYEIPVRFETGGNLKEFLQTIRVISTVSAI